MAHLSLAGHAGSPVVVDHCGVCRLVWFDPFESVQLAGLGWIALLRELQQQQQQAGGAQPPPGPPGSPGTAAACPVCRAALKAVHNSTRFGRFPALECPRCRGHLHSHSGLLAERGLVRPLLPPERLALLEERRTLCCLNCGAPSAGRGEDCDYCGSPLVMLDLPRLAHALRLRPGRRDEPAPKPEGRPLAWACRGCGAPLDPSRQTSCPQCRHAVVAPSLLDITALLDAVEFELRADLRAAANARAPRRSKTPRRRDWRETGLAGLWDRLRPDEVDEQTAGQLLGAAALMLVLLWLWLG